MADSNGYTRFPNWLLDEALPNCDSSEWAILCAVVRKTSGWSRDSEKISIADFSELTGIAGRQNITRAIKSLLGKGYLTRVQDGQAFIYSIATSNDSLLVTENNQSRIITSTGNESLPEVVTERDQFTPILKKEIKKEIKKGEDITPKNPFPFVPLGKVRNTEPTAADLRAQAIAFVCGLRLSVPRHRERCYNAAAQLNEFTPEYIIERYSSETGHWRMNDWRGRKGNMPTPEQCVDEITTVAHAPKLSSNGHHAPERPLTIDPTMPKPGQGGVW